MNVIKFFRYDPILTAARVRSLYPPSVIEKLEQIPGSEDIFDVANLKRLLVFPTIRILPLLESFERRLREESVSNPKELLEDLITPISRRKNPGRITVDDIIGDIELIYTSSLDSNARMRLESVPTRVALKVVDEIRNTGCVPNIRCLSQHVMGLVRRTLDSMHASATLDDVFDRIESMKRREFLPRDDTFDSHVWRKIERTDPGLMMDVLEDMVAQQLKEGSKMPADQNGTVISLLHVKSRRLERQAKDQGKVWDGRFRPSLRDQATADWAKKWVEKEEQQVAKRGRDWNDDCSRWKTRNRDQKESNSRDWKEKDFGEWRNRDWKEKDFGESRNRDWKEKDFAESRNRNWNEKDFGQSRDDNRGWKKQGEFNADSRRRYDDCARGKGRRY